MKSEYRVVGAPWALGASSYPAGDVVALEHVHEDGICLVWSTTLGMSLDAIIVASDTHEINCRYINKEKLRANH